MSYEDECYFGLGMFLNKKIVLDDRDWELINSMFVFQD